MSRQLPVLEVENPCDESWAGMVGDERTRMCGVCKHEVHDLGALTEADADALLARSEKLCVRFYGRADGRVVTADCAPIRYRLMKALERRAFAKSKRWAVYSWALLALLALATFVWGQFGTVVVSQGARSARGPIHGL